MRILLDAGVGARPVDYDRFIVVVGRGDAGSIAGNASREGGEFPAPPTEGLDLPDRPITGAWRLSPDGGVSPTSPAPWVLKPYEALGFKLQMRTMWAGIDETADGGIAISAAVLVPGGSSIEVFHLAAIDGGWSVVSVDIPWEE